jgi:lysozyme
MNDKIRESLQITKKLCRQFEGLRLEPYLCPAGIPTIGYGSTKYPNGTPIKISDAAISEQTAEMMLGHEVEYFVSATARICPILLAQPPNKLAAIADFSFNLGVGRLKQSTLRRCINKEEWEESGDQLLRWVWAAGRKLPGLVKRRHVERALFLGIEQDSDSRN